jgi:hypothetical protein
MPDFNAAAMVQAEINGLQQAVTLLSDNGRITRMVVATGADVFPGSEVMPDTANLLLTPETIAAIVAAMQTQIGVLEARLADAMQAAGA